MLPPNAVVKVLNAPHENGFVQVEWERKVVMLFRIDLEERGVEMEIGLG